MGAEIAGQTVLTAYGRLDRATLKEIQDHYDTRDLLQAADALPTVASDLVGQDGLRDMLLRLHGMVHSVINGAGLVVDVNTETLPELASEVAARLQEAISTLQRLASIIEPLACLQLRI